MITREAETWRPPVFSQSNTRVQRFTAALRRWLDLQAGSIWRDLRAILPVSEGVVVDVGCGAQPYRSLLGPNATYIGIDTADAKAHFGYEVPDTLYYNGDRWPLDDASADVVLCTETLEHVPDTTHFLAELARVLRPGGSVVLTVPFAARYHFIPHDYWRFTPASLLRVLSMAGFANVHVYARGNSVTVACYKAIALVLPLLLSPARSPTKRILRFVPGVICLPLVVALAGAANLSLRFDGGDDCLGYTVLAERS